VTVRLRTLPFLLLFGLSPISLALADPVYPTLSGRVVDEADILPPEVEQRIDSALAEHEGATSNQVVVVTVNDLQGYAIEEYGVGLGRAWGIGQAGKNNGALLIIAPNDREVRIEVGYGLEETLTDALSRNIIETQIIPQFKAGDMPAGIEAGVMAILAALGGTYQPGDVPSDPGENPDLVYTVAFFSFFIVAWIMSWRNRGRRRKGPRRWYDGFAGRIGSSGGGSGGGSFSGGGGSFGGGGASGRW